MKLLSLGRSISMVRNYQFRILNKILRDYPVPVTPPEYYLLSSIQENPGMTQYRLSQISGYSVQRCSQMLQKLEDLELTVVKSAEGYSTGRHIHATGAGERVIHEIYDLFSGYQDGALSGEERRLLAELDIPLQRISDLLQNNPNLKRDLRS